MANKSGKSPVQQELTNIITAAPNGAGEYEGIIEQIKDDINNLELSDDLLSDVRLILTDIDKGNPVTDNHITVLVETLHSGNDEAVRYADRLSKVKMRQHAPVVEATPVLSTQDGTSTDSIHNEAISKLILREPFSELFKMDKDLMEKIAADIRENGFRNYEPLRVWGNGNCLVDGYTRLAAATAAGLAEVPVVKLYFENENEALEYAIKAQTNRRNIADNEYLRLIEYIDNPATWGGARNKKDKTSGQVLKNSAAETASKLGISKTRVENARAVLKANDPKVIKALESESMTLNKAVQMVRKAKKKPTDSTEPVPDGCDFSGISMMLDNAINMADSNGAVIEILKDAKNKISVIMNSEEAKNENAA